MSNIKEVVEKIRAIRESNYKMKRISREANNERGIAGRIPPGHLPSYKKGIERGLELALELLDQFTAERKEP